MAEQTYNGWSNYPTWNVNLWLSNDQGLYEEVAGYVAATVDQGDENPRVTIADYIKELVAELSPDLGASFAADLLGYALDQVDWLEIAAAWLSDLEEATA